MTRAEVVLDASVVVRGLLDDAGVSAEIVDGVAAGATSAHAPDILVPEITNALGRYVEARRWPMEEAQERLAVFLALPITVHGGAALASAALALAAERGLTAYDAFYAALAGGLGIPLVTADRRFAAAVPGAELLG